MRLPRVIQKYVNKLWMMIDPPRGFVKNSLVVYKPGDEPFVYGRNGYWVAAMDGCLIISFESMHEILSNDMLLADLKVRMEGIAEVKSDGKPQFAGYVH